MKTLVFVEHGPHDGLEYETEDRSGGSLVLMHNGFAHEYRYARSTTFFTGNAAVENEIVVYRHAGLRQCFSTPPPPSC